MTLENKVALVTGAANGLGAGIVEALLARGAKVALSDVNETTLAATQARLDPARERSIIVVADVTDESAVGGFISMAMTAFGRVDALVNNAGVIHMGEAFGESKSSSTANSL